MISSRIHASARVCAALVLVLSVYACSSSTEPAPVLLQVSGTVRVEGSNQPVADARVLLVDRRSIYDIPYVLGSATTNASGQYSLSGETRRPGYANSCEFVLVYVEGYEATSAKQVGCTPQPQTIDLQILII